MEHDEDSIFTMSKDSNHISSQDIITRLKRTNNLLQPTINMASDYS